MAMLKYVKRVKEDNNGDAVLPSSSGPLATTVPSSRIDAIDDAVKPVVETLMEKGKAAARGPYENFSADEKARVAKRTAEYGVLSTVRHFSKIWSERPLKFEVGGISIIAKSILKQSGKEIVVRELIDQRSSTIAR